MGDARPPGRRRARLGTLLFLVAGCLLAHVVFSTFLTLRLRSGTPGWWIELERGCLSITKVRSYGGGLQPPREFSIKQPKNLRPPVFLISPRTSDRLPWIWATPRINGFGVDLRGFEIALLPAALILLVPGVVLNRLGLWASRRAGRCLRCGYDTNGLAPDAPCPECGTRIIAPNSKPAPVSQARGRTVRHTPDA